MLKSKEILEKINLFKKCMLNFDDNLAKLIVVSQRPIVDLIYEECIEMKLVIQLDNEETISRLKQINDLEIDTEVVSNPNLIEKINQINNESKLIIDKLDAYQKEAIKLAENKSNKIFSDDLNKLKIISDSFIIKTTECDLML